MNGGPSRIIENISVRKNDSNVVLYFRYRSCYLTTTYIYLRRNSKKYPSPTVSDDEVNHDLSTRPFKRIKISDTEDSMTIDYPPTPAKHHDDNV